MEPPPPIRQWAGLLSWLNALRDWVISIRPLRSATCELHETAAGTQILPQAGAKPMPGGAAAAAEKHHAFRVRLQTAPGSDPPVYQRSVEYRSKLLTGLAPVTAVAITGLATVDEPDVDDAGWAAVIPNDLIWLEVGFNTSGVPNAYNIRSYGAGDGWNSFTPVGGQSLVEWSGAGTSEDPFKQTKSRAVLARVIADGDGNPRLIQVAHLDFILTSWNVSGKVMQVLEPFAGGV